jgi:hypothetical protein
MVDRLPAGDGPVAITIGRRGEARRVQVFTGRCSEIDVAKIREVARSHDRALEVSLIKDPAAYQREDIETLSNPGGQINH